jgi:hypothetical protein
MTDAKSPTGLIQQALFERIAADEQSPDVYDHVLEGADIDYVVIGEAFSTPDNTHSGFGFRTVATLEVWTKQRGFKRASDIKDRLLQLFDHKPMELDGFHVVDVKFEFDQTLRDPNPKLRRAILRLAIRTEQDRE